ncbi:ribose-5-phosphate isomerase RpiA [Kaistia geumhonensis]|uniref:Ribose-5-phosphate isomerase A n=1 Tax=Kaistia geumhonensis TaxID=410839 RepID=A0ABU0M3G4_9HYPH|nr:ribose-5-phosphate isomerase RpiA [Kaistia geumhonensis]MCX5479294.1 ribose-5-phosphate isomerase RpiA [Kaistia geumhonensis]MDQ0515485.1 ribose 5-phosphate isomerase A [Kaistia geumhonensis]
MTDTDDLKRQAALAALEHVTNGMKLGIGTGSTAVHLVRGLGERVRGGLHIVGVPTSERTAKLAREEGIPLTTLDETPHLDLTIDGADELDRSLQLIKGGGGALLREKIVAAASDRMIVIADGSKLVDRLGAFPLPIEVNHFGFGATLHAIEAAAHRLGQQVTLKRRLAADGAPFVTDGGHAIVDASFGLIREPEAMSLALAAIPGVVEHGLFIGLATAAVIARPDGVVWLGA